MNNEAKIINTTESYKKPKKKVGKIVLIIVGAIVTFFVVVFVVVTVTIREPVSVGNQFMEFFINSDVDGVYSLTLQNDAFKYEAVSEVVNRISKQIIDKPRITGKKISTSVSGDTISTITYKMGGANNQIIQFKIQLIKLDNGEWKVVSFISKVLK